MCNESVAGCEARQAHWGDLGRYTEEGAGVPLRRTTFDRLELRFHDHRVKEGVG
jgi:hypothetical protein